MITCSRTHEIHCGHRVVGHEGYCRRLHGHSYIFEFTCQADNNGLDDLGRVIDFAVIKDKLCMWLENNWDHRTLIWYNDPMLDGIQEVAGADAIVAVPFNPTAENIGSYLVTVIGPQQLADTGVTLISVKVNETSKCSATITR